MTLAEGKNIAVVGGGVAGLTAAWLLGKKHHVTLFEKNPRIGGHTHTVVVAEGEDLGLAVDTGFIVCNDRTYEKFHKFLTQLGCEVRNADMSFGYEDEASGLQYSGSGLNGLLAQRSNMFKPSFWKMIFNILKFMKRGREALKASSVPSGSLGQFLSQHSIAESAVIHFVLPMGAAIWSAPREKILNFPAATFLKFFENHGLLSITNMPQWQTVVGGSHAYLKSFEKKFPGKIFKSHGVQAVRRDTDGSWVRLDDGSSLKFDDLVIAVHADEALKLLEDPSPEEKRLLGPWNYQMNRTVLHTDRSLLPSRPRAWASWNYVRKGSSKEAGEVTVTYHMNRLQGFKARSEYCVTLNMTEEIRGESILKSMDYMHPIFDGPSVATQAELPGLNGKNHTWFCGSYFGYGFHEDAVNSGAEVGRDFGVEL